MKTRIMHALALAVFLLPATLGCYPSAKVWVEDTQQLTVPSAGIETVRAKTHNGKVTLTGQEGGDILVLVTRKGGGMNAESAQACLDAIEIVSETNGGEHRLGWKWTENKSRDWHAQVNFEIDLPARMGTKVKTHNGGIAAKNLSGSCDLETHNGGVTVKDGRGPLNVQTHNGGIKVATAADQINLTTHNGGIKVDASGSARLAGAIQTHNGGIGVKVGESTSVDIDCRTYNGGINCSGPCKVIEKKKRSAKCRIGDGGSKLTVQTHNGGIKVGA